MMPKLGLMKVGCAAAAALALAGCGSGNEPLSILGSATSTPSLELPLADTTSTNTSFNWQLTPFNTTLNPPVDGFQFTNFSFSAAQSVLASGDGTVSDVSTSTTNGNTLFSVTIMHNIHISSRISQIGSSNVRVGDYVTTGQLIGLTLNSFSSSSVIAQLSVLVDGNAVCPYSYLSAKARNLINQHNFVGLSGVGICVQ